MKHLHIAPGMEINTEFKSDRLQFRPIKVSDWQAMQTALHCEKFPRQLPLARLKTKAQIIAWHESRVKDWESGSCYVWSIRHKYTQLVIGQLSLSRRGAGFALAYWIDPLYWGAGLATEACQALIHQLKASGFQNLLWAGTQPWNSASGAVLKKLGFQFTVQIAHELANDRIERINEYQLDFSLKPPL
ncbi:GNAT family N-acetyltransferase [Agarivorans sp. QJM3NY_25]|uniref:GNAT family N-acetyltransferase n=1 Tax=Agarivorans sp. QJM3NY_25 TaxID=3421430 RepID=UPI003D7C4C48